MADGGGGANARAPGGAGTTPRAVQDSGGGTRLGVPPLDDAFLSGDHAVQDLIDHWSDSAARSAISAEAMRGADRRAQRLGVPGSQLMEHAGAAVAATARAVVGQTGRRDRGPVLVLAGPGNNGGDGFVAARHLAAAGVPVAVVLVSGEETFSTADARRNWERLGAASGVQRMHAATPRDVTVLASGIDKAALIIDALLGSGVRGRLREPIRSAVQLVGRGREAGVPVLSVDCPTALDLTSGEPSDPVVRADVTVTFHRPKTGLQTRAGRALAGKVVVAPIGIPAAADVG